MMNNSTLSTSQNFLTAYGIDLSTPVVITAAATVFAILIISWLFFQPKRNYPPTVGGLPWLGAALKFGDNPINLLKECYDKHGEIFSIKLFGERMTFFNSPESAEHFFNASEEVYSANQAYKFTVPVFGKGVIYDVGQKKLSEQKKLMKGGLTFSRFRTYVDLIVEETEEYFEKYWGDEGEKDLLEAFNAVTVYTSTRALQGEEIRSAFNEKFAALYSDLDAALSPVGFFFPNAPLKAMRRRNAAREEYFGLFKEILNDRREKGDRAEDMLDTLMNSTYKDGSEVPDEEVMGMLVALLLAGQHTSNVSGCWTGIQLLRNPDMLKRVLQEQEDLGIADGKKLTFEMLKEMQVLESCMREAIRIRPPIVMVMRRVQEDTQYKGYDIPKGSLVSVSPQLCHSLESFGWTNPEKFDPDRFIERKEDKTHRVSYMGFGAGKHKCSGEHFAFLQVRAIWTTLLRKYEFELANKDLPKVDFTTLIATPEAPVLIKYKRRIS